MLTLQFVPYKEIEKLGSDARVKKLLKIVKTNRIVILEGRLKNQEEAELIKKTMEEIDSKFTGIELTVVYPEKEDIGFFEKAKNELANILLGDRQGLTVIGPANIVKEIKKDPEKIELLTKEKLKGK